MRTRLACNLVRLAVSFPGHEFLPRALTVALAKCQHHENGRNHADGRALGEVSIGFTGRSHRRFASTRAAIVRVHRDIELP